MLQHLKRSWHLVKVSQQWKAAKECLILESTMAGGQEGQGKQGKQEKQEKQGKQGKYNGKLSNFPNTDLRQMQLWKWATLNMKIS